MSESPLFPEPSFEIGGKVDEFHVSLCLDGEDLDPEEITRLLGTTPDDSHKKGDQRYSWRTNLRWTSGHWSIDVRSGAPDEIGNAIADVLDRIAHPGALPDLAAHYKPTLRIGIFLEAENRGFDLSPSLVERIGSYGLALDFDIYGQ
ncbi:MAG TPA: DUF4279 domain-containing protein [Dehalococcoidia bacterium]|nr:DUF4279 domain-containing protein [Dehalococcoidia bacterium]